MHADDTFEGLRTRGSRTRSSMTRRRFVGGGTAAIGAAIGAAAVPAPLWAQSKYGIKGRLAPELDVPYWIDANGKPSSFNLAAADGKWVFLKCFQSWCPGCHKHGFPALQKIVNEFGPNHPKIAFASIQTVFEGFGINTEEKVRKTQLQYDLPIPMGHDAGDPRASHQRSNTMRDYRTGGTPWMIVIAPNRQVAFNHFNINADRFIEVMRELFET